MIYDCFCFFNELDLLEIRLHELSPYVDKFVIVESTETFTGTPKPLCFEKGKDRFEEFKDKIIHIIVRDSPKGVDAWSREYFQRNQTILGLSDCNDDDIILVGAPDEFPIGKLLPGYFKKLRERNKKFNLNLRSVWYYFNCVTQSPHFIKGTAIGWFREAKKMSVQRFRHEQVELVDNNKAGWHLSWLGGAGSCLEKVKAWSHSEQFNKSPYTDEGYAAKYLGDPEGFGNWLNPRERLKIVPLDEDYPEYLHKNQEKFNHLIYKKVGT